MRAPSVFSPRETQLLLLAVALGIDQQEAWKQALNALRAGASVDDISAVVELASHLRGIDATKSVEELVHALERWQTDQRIAGAVAAYG